MFLSLRTVVWAPLVFAAFGILLVELVNGSRSAVAKNQKQSELISRASDARAVLERELYPSIYIGFGISSYVVNRRGAVDYDEMQSWLSTLFGESKYLRNIALAPDNRIALVYPLEENLPVLGLHYPDIPEQWPVVQALMASRQPLLQGPLTLVQGGEGLIYRIPVFIGDDYWGLVSTVIDADLLFAVLEEYSEESDLSLSLSTGALANLDRPFWRSSKSGGQLDGSVTLQLQGVEWVLTVSRVATSGWLDNTYRLIGWFLTVGLSFVLFFLLNSSQKRHEAQDRFTKNEERLQAILDGTHIGTWEWNVRTGETTFNERWAQIIGYTLQELEPVNIDTWMSLAHPGDLEASGQQLQQHFSGEIPFYDIRCRMKHKHGHWVWVHDRGRVMTWTDDGKPLMMFGTHSDVTKEVSAQQALQQQKDLLRVIVDNIPINVYIKDRAGKKVMANRAERLFMGLDPDTEDFGLHDEQFLPPNLASVSGEEDRRVFETGESILASEHESIGPDGQPMWQLVSKIPLKNERGEVSQLLGITVDITGRKAAEVALQDSESRLRALFEMSPVGIALNDYESGAFLDVNDALLASVGYSREDFLQLNYWQVTPEEYLPHEEAATESLLTTGRYGPIEKEYIDRNGDRFPVRLSGVLIEDRSGRRLIWSIIEDIRERKRIDRLKQEFVSTVSHELRTPLTAISGSLGLVRAGVLGTLPPQALEMVTIAHDSSQRLTLLINDLLDMDKLIAGKMALNLKPLDAKALLQRAVRENQPYAEQYGVLLQIFECDESMWVVADEHRFMQVMNNLLSNAAKFTADNSSVEISVVPLEKYLRINVKDYGAGIPVEFQDKIFGQFSQADASDTRRRGGTGLGLAISKRLVELMHGRIGYETTPGKGSCFYVELPLAERAH
ncbi:PAS domain S-box protein [Salinispirillum sp. LH 10-3-1]|uniref:histidine kinase n=1 Tax=Salinispirillum sp. LH 10-3-1 TaxID=2952525 RepID=A0AB38YET5_9GAMM